MWCIEQVIDALVRRPCRNAQGLACVSGSAHSSLWLAVLLVDGVAEVAQLYERVAALLGAVKQGVLKLDVPAQKQRLALSRKALLGLWGQGIPRSIRAIVDMHFGDGSTLTARAWDSLHSCYQPGLERPSPEDIPGFIRFQCVGFIRPGKHTCWTPSSYGSSQWPR